MWRQQYAPPNWRRLYAPPHPTVTWLWAPSYQHQQSQDSPNSVPATAHPSTNTDIESEFQTPTLAHPASIQYTTQNTYSPVPHIPLHLVWGTSGRLQSGWQSSWPHSRSSGSGAPLVPVLNLPHLITRERWQTDPAEKKKVIETLTDCVFGEVNRTVLGEDKH